MATSQKQTQNLRKSNSYKYKRYAVILFIAILLSRIAFSLGFLSPTFLFHDDTFFVASYFFDADPGAPTTQFYYYGALKFLTGFGSLLIPKLSLFVLQSILGCCFYLIVFNFYKSHIASISLAIFAIYYPVSVDQYFFMTGAHPLAATAIFFIFLALFSHQLNTGLNRKLGKNLGMLALQGLLLIICGGSSPTYLLIPLILILTTCILIFLSPARPRLNLSHTILLICSAIPFGLHVLSMKKYHYSKLIGWTEYSADQVFSNLLTAFSHIFIDPMSGNTFIKLAYLCVFTILLCIILWAILKPAKQSIDIRTPNSFIFVGVCLLAAALTFGPSAITTTFIPRYTYAPFLITELSLAILIGGIIRRMTKQGSWRHKGIHLCLILATLIAIPHSIIKTNDVLEPYISGHKLVVDTLAAEDWSSEDQIAIVLPEGVRSVSAGYNHWSTWYLRVITKQRNLIGLVGPYSQKRDLENNELFVDKYSDHGDQYWAVINNRSLRQHMKGLERNRPVTIYIPTEDGTLKKTPLLMSDGTAIKLVPSGQKFTQASDSPPLDTVCQTYENISAPLLVNTSKPIFGNTEYKTILSEAFSTQKANTKTITVPPTNGRLTKLILRLQNTTSVGQAPLPQKYSATYPPMPALGPDFAVYVANGQLEVLATNGIKVKGKNPFKSGDITQIELLGCSGLFGLLSINGQIIGMHPSPKFDGKWEIGKGYMERFWAGNVEEFSVQVLKSKNPTSP